jgi:hypothetical protein
MIATLALLAAVSAPPDPVLLVERGMFAFSSCGPQESVQTIAGHLNDPRDRAMLFAAVTGFPQWFPQIQPALTPMQACFKEAREACREAGGSVCWVYFIPALGDACLFGCTIDGNCPEPPPIPPIPSPASALDFMLASLAQQAAVALEASMD